MATNNAVNTSLAGQTGTGTFVGSTSPTLVAPTLGAALATSINFGGSSLANYVSQTAWTPTFTFATPGDISVVYTTQLGIYTRIGSVVFYSFSLAFTPTFTTSAGAMTIGGFPITINNPTGFNISQNVDLTSAGFTYPAGRTAPVALPISGTTTMIIQAQGSNIAQASFTPASIVSGAAITLQASGFHFV